MPDKESGGQFTGELDYMDQGEQFKENQKKLNMSNIRKGTRRLAWSIWFVSFALGIFALFSVDTVFRNIPDTVLTLILLVLFTFPWPVYFFGWWVARGFGYKNPNSHT